MRQKMQALMSGSLQWLPQSRLTETCSQFLIDVLKRDAVMTQDHQGVEEEVRDFVNDLLALAAFGCQQDLSSLLGYFFENLVVAALK